MVKSQSWTSGSPLQAFNKPLALTSTPTESPKASHMPRKNSSVRESYSDYVLRPKTGSDLMKFEGNDEPKVREKGLDIFYHY